MRSPYPLVLDVSMAENRVSCMYPLASFLFLQAKIPTCNTRQSVQQSKESMRCVELFSKLCELRTLQTEPVITFLGQGEGRKDRKASQTSDLSLLSLMGQQQQCIAGHAHHSHTSDYRPAGFAGLAQHSQTRDCRPAGLAALAQHSEARDCRPAGRAGLAQHRKARDCIASCYEPEPPSFEFGQAFATLRRSRCADGDREPVQQRVPSTLVHAGGPRALQESHEGKMRERAR